MKNSLSKGGSLRISTAPIGQGLGQPPARSRTNRSHRPSARYASHRRAVTRPPRCHTSCVGSQTTISCPARPRASWRRGIPGLEGLQRVGNEQQFHGGIKLGEAVAGQCCTAGEPSSAWALPHSARRRHHAPMCRFLAYAGDPILLEDLVCKPSHSLVKQSLSAVQARTVTNGDGFGIGWYGERPEPGVYREVMPAWSDENLFEPVRQRALTLLPRPCAPTGGGIARQNCHPSTTAVTCSSTTARSAATPVAPHARGSAARRALRAPTRRDGLELLFCSSSSSSTLA